LYIIYVFVLELAEGFSEGALDLALHYVDLVTSCMLSLLHSRVIEIPYLGGLGLRDSISIQKPHCVVRHHVVVSP
jgi:hypothetical protein